MLIFFKQGEPAASSLLRAFSAFHAFSIAGALSCLFALDAGAPVQAQALTPAPTWQVSTPKCPLGNSPTPICLMTIKIFNNDANNSIYPVLTTGKGPEDIWMQAWWSVPKTALSNYPFPRRKNYRLYINPTGAGIPPNTGIQLTVPIITQLKPTINARPTADPTSPTGGDTLINWWNGAIIQVYTSPTKTPPVALQQALKRSTQKVVTSSAPGAILPKCVGVKSAPTKAQPNPPAAIICQPLTIYSDDSDLAKNDPQQLIEYTFGAKNLPADPKSPTAYLLDTANVDFDVSYVNVAFAPAVIGPYKNDQVGYIGTPLTVSQFTTAIDQFLQDPNFAGWPQFRRDGALLKKLASPLEAFARLSGKNAPTDLTQVTGWPGTWPAQIWKPIQTLRDNWQKYAGKVTAAPAPTYVTATPGICGPLPAPNAPAPTNFCAAVVAVQQLMIKNYVNYRNLYTQRLCPGTPYNITNDLLISHVYGWAPWTESTTGKDGDGCKADQNKLEKTPGYSTGENYTNYLGVKVAFDKMNYGTLPAKVTGQIYNFNPWVQFVHGVPGANPPKYVSTPYAYAYSVDDAMGNIQAEGQGIIIDIGDVANLENKLPATKPLLVTLGAADPLHHIQYSGYAACKIENRKVINPNFTTFEINGNNPANCPIYVWDNKAPNQLYVFKIDAKPQDLPFIEKPTEQIWTAGNAAKSTTRMVACSGLPNADPSKGYQQSSQTECCDSISKSGVYAFAQPEPHDAHNTRKYIVKMGPPKPCTNDTDKSCYAPRPPSPTKACNRGL